MIRTYAPHAQRVVFETGPQSSFYYALTSEDVPAICIEARHAHKVLNETLNKTDANDADGLAQLAEGFYSWRRKVSAISSPGFSLPQTSLPARGFPAFHDFSRQLLQPWSRMQRF